ncbi:hypothetical protein G9C98_001007 [Cotesia typhae]|uniref:60S ribosome subunit biogenesis protein NIP7 homolog n=1 Tax=Cotesia typhae TaxID=2053667 RepID=A0A8J5R286_9HYME|nr:hypothetical protein G9C98_001007 [Cotesia typhae]
MRRLTEDRTKLVFEKLAKYIGDNVKILVDRPDGIYCFREKKGRVYYVSEKILALAATVAPDNLVSFGTCIATYLKFLFYQLTNFDKFLQHKIWLKPAAEQQFLYGHNITKGGLGKITENTPHHQGVVIYSMNDVPLGFGVTSKSSNEIPNADPISIVCYHQSDIGEYIRSEDNLL